MIWINQVKKLLISLFFILENISKASSRKTSMLTETNDELTTKNQQKMSIAESYLPEQLPSNAPNEAIIPLNPVLKDCEESSEVKKFFFF